MTTPGLDGEGRLQATTDAAEMLWVVLANVSGGDWTQQSAEWQEAAAHWRDNYFAAIGGKGVSVPAAPPPQAPKETGLDAWYPTIRQEVEALSAYVLLSPEGGIEPDCKHEILRRLKDLLPIAAPPQEPI
jgi:hypothetical protein